MSINFQLLCNKLPQTSWPKTTHIYYLTVPVGQTWVWHNWVLCSAFHRLKSRCQQSSILIWSSGFCSKHTEMVSRIQLLILVGLRSPLACWLSAGDLSLLLDTDLRSEPCGPLHSSFTMRFFLYLLRTHLTRSGPCR